MAFPLARSAHNATNSLHSLIYFVPETEQELSSTGLRPGRMCYFAGRAAPMGAVSGGVVTATFYNFSPALVARSIPLAWELASPAVVISARFAAADAALTRLLGPEVIASAGTYAQLVGRDHPRSRDRITIGRLAEAPVFAAAHGHIEAEAIAGDMIERAALRDVAAGFAI